MVLIGLIGRCANYGRALALELAVDMTITRSLRTVTSALLAVAVVLLTAPGAMAQSHGRGDRGDKLDKFLRHRARQLSGRTRVIVQFKGDSDVRLLGKRAAAGRRLGRGGQVAEVDNAELSKIAADPRVEGVYLDRPIFATMERTGLSTGASLVRDQMNVTGRGIGVAVIDSGITNWHDDLTSRHVARLALQGLHQRHERVVERRVTTITAMARTSRASSRARDTTRTASTRASRRERSWLA